MFSKLPGCSEAKVFRGSASNLHWFLKSLPYSQRLRVCKKMSKLIGKRFRFLKRSLFGRFRQEVQQHGRLLMFLRTLKSSRRIPPHKGEFYRQLAVISSICLISNNFLVVFTCCSNHLRQHQYQKWKMQRCCYHQPYWSHFETLQEIFFMNIILPLLTDCYQSL